MAIRHVSIKDFSPEQRRAFGEARIRELRRSLALPLTDEARKKIEDQIASAISMMQAPGTPSQGTPSQDHQVVLRENLTIKQR